MKLGTQLLAAPLFTALSVLTVGGINTALMHRETAQSAAVFKARLDDVSTLGSAQDQLGHVHANAYRTLAIVASLDDASLKAARNRMEAELQGVKRTITGLGEVDGVSPELAELAKQASQTLDAYKKQADSALDMASVDANTGVAAMQTANETHAKLSQISARMMATLHAHANAITEASAERTLNTNLMLGVLALLAAGTAVAVSAVTQGKLVRELKRASQCADAVADGKLRVDTQTERKDEVGDLMRSLGRMTTQLNVSLAEVLRSADSIGTASVEIASGNQDLSHRTEQTASNLQMAASSMEQLTGTVRQSADSARQANQLAASAAEVAARGGEVVSQVVSTMDDINASSKRIGDIIGVIDGIAFQTNILALNAAVEAARAGEQGRGFAVVAAEVRSLAGRSAEAAREIKSLIGASVEKVEGGARLVADAGQTMSEIVGSVQRVTDIIGEISAAASEQSDGIGQVNGSVVQLDQMTQQNAALVEQSAAAAESLKEQAQRLRLVVNKFQLASV
jgi:methyl-accepting chemotaxis protein